ncbi:CAAX amino protease [Streptomyces gougerotii]|uniref:CAAX amino protease n=6 Tax=Streptomyces TaxID=1883 RepID=A0A8H9LUT9_9ACTN|nr:CPBP family intramembrane metalloprotease [Streptomyces sp. SID7982]NEE44468.1 CPBP family intramembrane metalloprotease [Streptomyces sp. SID8455]QNE81855.1 CPBP family intramembrane metalloprotease [Streptomyces rutgersensis]WSU37100.1 CPBP family intramembrane metalloprotease [Streptomyces gougerotii]GFH77440.1 CAAX amino protease [Streptomyces gougerotii]
MTQTRTGPSGFPVPDPAPARLREMARARPLTYFFLLANGLSWVAWLPYILSQNGLGVWDHRFPAILGTTQVLGVLPGAYLGPIGAAFVMTALVDGRTGLRAWTRRLWRWRVGGRWYAITLLSVPAGMLLTGLAFSGGQVAAPSAAALTAFVPMLLFQMITTGLAEEPGWRDFALPRLQSRFSPLRAAFVLGPLWGVWHLPLFLTEWGGYPEASWTRPLAFLTFCVAFNIVMSWVFNRTGQSLPLSMLMHVGVNTFASVMWSEMFPGLDGELALVAMGTGASVAAAVIVVATRGRLGHDPLPPFFSPGHGGTEPSDRQTGADRARTTIDS